MLKQRTGGSVAAELKEGWGGEGGGVSARQLLLIQPNVNVHQNVGLIVCSAEKLLIHWDLIHPHLAYGPL